MFDAGGVVMSEGCDVKTGNVMVGRLVAAWNEGLTIPQLVALMMTAEEPRRIGEVCRRVGVSSAAGTQLVDRLETRGWIRRDLRSEDRRATVLVATEEGAAALKRVMEGGSDA